MANEPVSAINTPAIEAEVVTPKAIVPWFHVFFSDGSGLYPSLVIYAHLNGSCGISRRPVDMDVAYALSLGKERNDILDTWIGSVMKVEALQEIVKAERKRNSQLTIEAAEYHSHQITKCMALGCSVEASDEVVE
jgi:hypothetical protein